MTREVISDASAVILAGGRAQRMGGRFKPFLVVENRRVIDRQLDVLLPAFERVAVSIAPDTRFDVADVGVDVVVDVDTGQGPLAGVAAALAWASSGWLFVVAGDMPFLATDVVAALAALRGPDVDAVCPVVGDRYEPLHAFYRANLASLAARRVSTERRSMQALLSAHEVRVRTLLERDLRRMDPTLRCLTNLNRAQDLPC